MVTTRRKPTLTPDEARELHDQALVIDSQQPGATGGLLFTDSMRAALDGYVRDGLTPRGDQDADAGHGGEGGPDIG